MKKTCDIYLVRHGETDWNKEKRMQGSIDIPLNDEGRAQARALQKRLENVSFDAVYSSDLARAKETAEIFAQGTDLNVTASALLRERSWGDHEGQILAEVKAKYGTSFKPLIEHYDHHQSDQLHPDFLQVESYSSAVNRVLPFLTGIKEDGKSLLVVSHGGVLKGLLLYLKHEEFKYPYVDNTAYLHLEVSETGFRLKGYEGVSSKPA